MAGSWMDDEAGRLVDDDQMFVFIRDGERDRLGFVAKRGGWGQGDTEGLPVERLARGVHRRLSAGVGDLAARDQCFDPFARKLGHHFGKRAVEPKARGLAADPHLNDFAPTVHCGADMETVPEISSALLTNLMRLAWVGPYYDGVLGPPDEKCGLLRGRGHRVLRADPAANVAADPFTTFEIDPVALIAAHRAARRQGGLELLGYYHTHPTGDAWPSETDAACAAPDGKLWLIAAQGQALLFRAVESGAIHGRFNQLLFDLVVGKRAPERVGGVRLR